MSDPSPGHVIPINVDLINKAKTKLISHVENLDKVEYLSPSYWACHKKIKGYLNHMKKIEVNVGTLHSTKIGKLMTKYGSQLHGELADLAKRNNETWQAILLEYRENFKKRKFAKEVEIKDEPLSQDSYNNLLASQSEEFVDTTPSPNVPSEDCGEQGEQDLTPVLKEMQMNITTMMDVVSSFEVKCSEMKKLMLVMKDRIDSIEKRSCKKHVLTINGNSSSSSNSKSNVTSEVISTQSKEQSSENEELRSVASDEENTILYTASTNSIFEDCLFSDSGEKTNGSSVEKKEKKNQGVVSHPEIGSDVQKNSKKTTKNENCEVNIFSDLEKKKKNIINKLKKTESEKNAKGLQRKKIIYTDNLGNTTQSIQRIPSSTKSKSSVFEVDSDGFTVPQHLPVLQNVITNNGTTAIVLGEPVDEVEGVDLDAVDLEDMMTFSQAVDQAVDIDDVQKDYLRSDMKKNRTKWNTSCKTLEGVKYPMLLKSKGRMKAAHKASTANKSINALLKK